MELLDAIPEPSFDNLSRLAASVCKAPTALVSILDFQNDRQFFKSHRGLPEPWATMRETPLSHSFCQHVVRSNQPLVVTEAERDTRVCENRAVEDLNVTAYLGVPIALSDTSESFGALCVIDSVPREWTIIQIDQLKQIARCVADLVHLKMAQHELGESDEHLRRTNAAMKEFTKVVAGEVHTPLQRIRSFGELLRKEGQQLTEDGRAYLNLMLSGTCHLQTVVSDLLEMTRLKTSNRRLEMVDAADVFQLAQAMLQSEIDRTSTQIVVDPLPNIYVDKLHLVSLFYQLLSNAIKFNEKVPQIRVSSIPGDDQVTIVVEDNGIGIEPANVQRVFQAFNRLHPSDAYGGGTGSGLAICRQIVNRWLGEIKVDSKPGRGSRFSFTCPVRPLNQPPS